MKKEITIPTMLYKLLIIITLTILLLFLNEYTSENLTNDVREKLSYAIDIAFISVGLGVIGLIFKNFNLCFKFCIETILNTAHVAISSLIGLSLYLLYQYGIQDHSIFEVIGVLAGLLFIWGIIIILLIIITKSLSIQR